MADAPVFEMSEEQKAMLLSHNHLGYDPRESYGSLWPSDPPVGYEVFLLHYTRLAVQWLKLTGKGVRPAQDEDDEESSNQRREIRRGLHDAFQEALGLCELTEDQSRRYQALCKLAGAHAQQCKRKREDEKYDLDTAASIHNLCASNAERDRD